MDNEPVGGPEGTTVDPNQVAPPEPDVNATPPAQSDTDALAQFIGDDGTLDKAKLQQELKNYGELQSEHGRQSNEVGDARKQIDRYKEFVNAQFVDDPQNPGTPIHKSELVARERTAQGGQLNNEQIDERLRELMDEHPDQYTEMMLEAATTQAVERMTQREQAFSSPAAKEILAKHPDIRPLAERIAQERRIPIDSALKEAIGEKFLNFASGDNAPGITLPVPPVNLGSLTTPSRTFMAPGGTIPEQKPKSNLTEAQIAAGKRMGLTTEQMEPHADEPSEPTALRK